VTVGGREQSVPQYFFTIHRGNRVKDDADGTYLPDVAAALSYAEHTIQELRKKSGYDDLALMMFVMDQCGKRVLSLPFWPGC
jgi:hypothetical protein